MYGSVFKDASQAGQGGRTLRLHHGCPASSARHGDRYLLTEDSGGNAWGFGVFDDEKLYRANAADPEQGKVYDGFHALLEADPEWHDGTIVQRPA